MDDYLRCSLLFFCLFLSLDLNGTENSQKIEIPIKKTYYKPYSVQSYIDSMDVVLAEIKKPVKIYKSKKLDIYQELYSVIRKSEGFLERADRCIAQKAMGEGQTIGYGHVIKPGEKFKYITRNTADSILYADVQSAYRVISEFNLTKGQKTALTSFIYCLGSGNFEKSSLYRKLKSGDTIEEQDFTKWCLVKVKKTKSGYVYKEIESIKKRRKLEYTYFYN